MKITFYAHASFRLEGDGLTVITDPYTCAKSKFEPINEPADIVLMSSATDDFHSDPSHVQGNPEVVNTLHLPPEGRMVKGLTVRSFPATESLTFDYQSEYGRDPDANALYHFTLGGLRFLHMGHAHGFRLRRDGHGSDPDPDGVHRGQRLRTGRAKLL